jgi:putative copper export protein
VAGFQFNEDFLLLQIKYDLLASGQDRAYSFRNARNRKDAAQRLQRFVDWGGFAVLALNVHGLRHRAKTISVFSRLVKLRLRWMFLSK